MTCTTLAPYSSSVLTTCASNAIARSFRNSILFGDLGVYFFFGRTLPWADDTAPPDASLNYQDVWDTRNDMVHIRKVRDAENSWVIPYNPWTNGVVYDRYDPTYSVSNPAFSRANSLAAANMFVLTSENHIYKCIDNDRNAASIVEPSGTSTDYIETGDGYVWKYMMTLSDVQISKFLSADWMPIKNAIQASSNFANDGIHRGNIRVVTGGTGYSYDNTVITVVGDGVGCELKPIIDAGVITGVEVIDNGLDYTFANVTVSSPDGNLPLGGGASIAVDFEPVDFNNTLIERQINTQLNAVCGDLSSLELLTPGAGYTQPPTVKVVGDGTGAEVGVIMAGDQTIDNIYIISRGSGYTYMNLEFVSTPGTVSTPATARAIVSPSCGHGGDIVEESCANTLGFWATTQEEYNQGMLTTCDYRQIGLMVAPNRISCYGGIKTNKEYTSSIGAATYYVGSVDIAANDYAEDMIVIKKNAANEDVEYAVVAYEDNQLLLQSLTGIGIEERDVFFDTAGVQKFTVGSVTPPEFDKFSGSVLYYENREPFRTPYKPGAESTVIFRTYLTF